VEQKAKTLGTKGIKKWMKSFPVPLAFSLSTPIPNIVCWRLSKRKTDKKINREGERKGGTEAEV